MLTNPTPAGVGAQLLSLYFNLLKDSVLPSLRTLLDQVKDGPDKVILRAYFAALGKIDYKNKAEYIRYFSRLLGQLQQIEKDFDTNDFCRKVKARIPQGEKLYELERTGYLKDRNVLEDVYHLMRVLNGHE